jgi:ketosteroid isomerase-like protein
MKFNSAQAAETAFYDAFQRADLEAMMLIWHQHEALCIHPFGQRIEGRDAVRRSWRDIFCHEIELRITLSHVRCLESDGLAVHLVYENIAVVQVDDLSQSTVLATNAYRLVEDSWQIVLHHASPVPPGVQDSGVGSGRIH